MNSMRKFSYSGTPRKRERDQSDGLMYSTPAENCPPTPSAYNFHDRPDTRPTIEQIAMGLHVSRTPHLLPQRSVSSPHVHNHPHHHNRRSVDSPRVHSPLLTRPTMHIRRASTSAVVLPPPPPRSSLKKMTRLPTLESATLAPSASDASLSTLTTQTSNGPATPRSAQSAPATSFPGKLRFEMLKLLPSRKGSLSSTDSARSDSLMTPSDTDSLSGGLTPRKSVRFSPGVPDSETEMS
ncbi:hypothetical protein L226DRAFT_465521 [Lentinus tigrinus ALCF2SS1-7]|uniref:Uncharacterized protein n=1 Tax=Lentinus tigrinus ALCF2SS1-6 TaxID=1328759 RepID=A0A5C2S717_9APHY|nr:hypothetical protein L227DRAFT_504475 [Lentinus tigrinus ALCF2SS1-6]RPD73218.1 hypothetical protein L226DRAFT_465521 [Lentinus tigrinus ALCF2SS1-7]